MICKSRIWTSLSAYLTENLILQENVLDWCTFFSSLLTRSTAPHLHTTPDIYLKDYCNVESSDELYSVSSRQILVHKIYWDSINQLPSWIFHSNNISWWPFNEKYKILSFCFILENIAGINFKMRANTPLGRRSKQKQQIYFCSTLWGISPA